MKNIYPGQWQHGRPGGLCLGHLCHPGAGLQCERGVLLPEGWYAEQGEAGGLGEGLHCTMNWDRNELECLSNLVSKSSENDLFVTVGCEAWILCGTKLLSSQLLQAYKWSNRLQSHAGLASGLLNQQSLKCSANQIGVSETKSQAQDSCVTTSICWWCDQLPWQDISWNVHPLIQTQSHISNASNIWNFS